mmetsp:Transcript_24874/g.37218  ORF Transcript_24874/g.37218 Transcript_24874/m.37218 type:complete len:201 (-) Transcript_24874:979-1581(-)
MLAPRKKLWSTPTSCIEAASRFINLQPNDVFYDVGCGDGRVIIHIASRLSRRSRGDDDYDKKTENEGESNEQSRIRMVGIEIDPDRAQEARDNVEAAYVEKWIPDFVDIEIRCANALEVEDFGEATVAFLYLVPRGLKLIKPLLLSGANQSKNVQKNSMLRVVTYMAGFQDETAIAMERCKVDHQEGAAWPIYLYHFERL